MKRAIFILITALAALTARAGDLPEANAFYTFNQFVFTNGFTTNQVIGGTNYCEDSLYHTWYFNTTSNLNGGLYLIDFSGDQTNWVNWGTVAGSTSVAGTAETNAVFKQSYWRLRTQGTNVVFNVKYLGGR